MAKPQMQTRSTSALLRTFILVMSVSPFNHGNFGRAGLRFNRDWRALEVVADDEEDLDNGKISHATRDRLEAETMLAVKPADEAALARLESDRSTAVSDPIARIAQLEREKADLEARMLRLEMGAAVSSRASDAKG